MGKPLSAPFGHPGSGRLVIELVGPAGCGKTTLLRALQQRHGELRTAADLRLGRLHFGRCLAADALRLAPAWLPRRQRWLSREELRSMAYLRAWHERLYAAAPAAPLVLDHGPVFRLARLRAFGPPLVNTPCYRDWWQEMQTLWAQTLRWIVWLDAPNATLLARVRGRAQTHLIKQAAAPQALRFFDRYRAVYRDIIDAMTAAERGPGLITIDTEREPAEAIAARLCAFLFRQPDSGKT